MFRRRNAEALKPVIGYLTIACAVVAWLNAVGKRFPYEDMMLNDLMILNKFYFAQDLLRSGLFSAVDFTQGLGVNISSDVKTQLSFFDPGLPLITVFTPTVAANVRYFLLLVYAVGGVVVFAASYGRRASDRALLFLPILYVGAPFFLGEVSHQTGVMFLPMPMALYAVRRFLLRATRLNAAMVCATATLLAAVSDLNVFILLPALMIYQAILDWHIVRRRFWRFAIAYAIAGAVLVVNFSDAVLFTALRREPTVINNLSDSSFADYQLNVLMPLLRSLVAPRMAGAITWFLNPLLLAFGVLAVWRVKHPFVRRAAAAVAAFVVVSLVIGVASVTVPPMKAHVPSYVRYSFGAAPCLFVLSMLAVLRKPSSRRAIDEFVTRSRGLLLIAAVPATALLVFVVYRLGGPGVMTSCLIYAVWLWLPITYWLWRPEAAAVRAGTHVALAIGLPVVAGLLLAFVMPGNNLRVLDPVFSSYYMRDLPACVARLSGNHGGSFIPIANGPYGDRSGRNAGMQSLVELPNLYGGRTFFQWRHYYPQVTAALYKRVKPWPEASHAGVNFYPASPASLPEIPRMAEETHSRYVYTMDLPIDDARFRLLGSCQSTAPSIVRDWPRIPPAVKRQLLGEVRVYEHVTPNADAPAPDFSYAKTTMTVHNPIGAADIAVPVVYSPTLVARSSAGRSVPVERAANGLVALRGVAADREVTIGSFAWLRTAPLFGMGAIVLALFLPVWSQERSPVRT